MKECVINVEERNGVFVLRLDGSLDAYSFPNLEAQLKNLKDKDHNKVILDCSGLDYIHSAALGAFIGFARMSRERKGDLKLVNLSPKIYNIIELLGFHKILEIHKNLDKALAQFA